MTKRSCDAFREQIAEYLCDGLPEEEADTLLGHLSECSVCKQELDSLRETLTIVDEAHLATPPGELADSVTAKVLDELRGANPLPKPRSWPRAIASIAACLLIGLVGVFLADRGRPDDTLEAQAAAVAAHAESVLRLVDELERENEILLALVGSGAAKESETR